MLKITAIIFIFIIISCGERKTRLDFECSSYKDCSVAEKCVKEQCIDDLSDEIYQKNEETTFLSEVYSEEKYSFYGRVILPEKISLSGNDLAIHKLTEEIPLDSSLLFSVVTTSKGVTILPVIKKENSKLFMVTIFPHDTSLFKNNKIEISSRETAVSLIFLQPGIGVSNDPVVVKSICDNIRNLTITRELSSLIETKLEHNIDIFTDTEIKNLTGKALLEFFFSTSTKNLEAENSSLKDSVSGNFFHIKDKKQISPNSQEIDKVIITHTYDGAHFVKAQNTLPRWVYYYGEFEATTAHSTNEPPFLSAPPLNYLSKEILKAVSGMIETDPLYVKNNYKNKGFSLPAYLSGYISRERITESAKVTTLHEIVDTGFLSGFFPGFSLPEYDLSRNSTIATIMNWTFLPFLFMNMDFGTDSVDKFYKNQRLISFIFFTASNIAMENPLLLKNTQSYQNNPEFGRDAYTETALNFKEFLGMESKRAIIFLREAEKYYGKEFIENIINISKLYFSITNPMDVKTNNGLGLGAVHLSNTVFTEYSEDFYYITDKDN